MSIRILVMLVMASICMAVGWFGADAWLRRENHEDAHDPLVLDLRRKTHTRESSSRPAPTEAPSAHAIQFENAADRLGINFVYYEGGCGQYHLFETTGGGMALADFDRDGQLDVFFTNGARLPLQPEREQHHSSLYLRQSVPPGQDASFWDASVLAHLDERCYGQGCAAADFDNDGFEDLLVLGVGKFSLFRNQGDGTFTRHQERTEAKWWTTAVWCDFDQDGDLDLMACAYADFDLERPVECHALGRRAFCIPLRYRPQSDIVLENLANGQFREITRECGATENSGRGLGIAAADFTGDGKPDVYVANDMSEAFFWVNQSDRSIKFSDQALDRGVSHSGKGTTMSGMGVAVGDFDRNGWLDIGVSDFFEAGVSLFANQGGRGFIHKGQQTKITAPTRSKLGFGCAFLDADLDGYPDFVVANGHVSDYSFAGLPYKMPAQFLHNKQGNAFSEISLQAGEYFRQNRLGRGLAVGDLNDDGRVDIVISNIRDPAALLMNRTRNHGHWIGLDLIGLITNRNARNVRIVAKSGSIITQHETISGAGYFSSSDARLVIGLGTLDGIDSLEIHWPAGKIQKIGNPKINGYLMIREPTE